MNNIFASTLNTRPILENSLRFIRSDVPTSISEDEKVWLLKNNITSIIDLRSDNERLRKGCPLFKDNRFTYHCMPVTGGNAVPPTVDDVSKSYISMVDEQMDRIIETAWNSDSNVLYFCNAGKDRTGVMSAILLHKSGMDLQYIIDGYMKTKANLKEVLEAFAKDNPSINIDVITPSQRYMKEFLEWYINSER